MRLDPNPLRNLQNEQAIMILGTVALTVVNLGPNFLGALTLNTIGNNQYDYADELKVTVLGGLLLAPFFLKFSIYYFHHLLHRYGTMPYELSYISWAASAVLLGTQLLGVASGMTVLQTILPALYGSGYLLSAGRAITNCIA